MLVLKVVGCVLVIISCSGMGLYFSECLKTRIEELVELKKIIVLLRGNIRYANTPLSEALHSIAMRNQGDFSSFLQWVSSQMEEMSGNTMAEIWELGVKKYLKNTALSKMDCEELIQFGKSLGYLDKEMQLGTIDLYIASLETEIEESLKCSRQKIYLYNSLGVMGGIFITIILI